MKPVYFPDLTSFPIFAYALEYVYFKETIFSL